MNIKALVTAISLIPQLLPLVSQTVQSIETVMDGVAGSDKLKAAEAQINTYLSDFATDVSVIADLKTVLAPLINAAVAAFNAAGIFKKAAPAGAAAS